MEIETKKQETQIKHLTNRTEVEVRFSEVDALGIVWHGNYIKYFEDGREAFGREYGLSYLDAYKEGFASPIVKLNVDFKKIVRYGERIIVETTFINNPASKIIFNYKIYLASTNEFVAGGETVQVFVNLKHELYITTPEFFENWKKKMLM